ALPAEGLLGAARLAPSGSPFGRSTSLRDVVEPVLFMSGVRIDAVKRPMRGRVVQIFLNGLPAEGFEPPTYGLQNRCTTTVLSRQGAGRRSTDGGPGGVADALARQRRPPS